MTLALGIFSVILGHALIVLSENVMQAVIGLACLAMGSIFVGLELSK